MPPKYTPEELEEMDLTAEELAGLTDESLVDEGDEIALMKAKDKDDTDTDTGDDEETGKDEDTGEETDKDKAADDKSEDDAGDKADAGDDDGDKDQDGGDDDSDEDPETKKKKSGDEDEDTGEETDDDASDDADGDGEDDDTAPAARHAFPNYTVPENAKERFDELRQQRRDLAAKFDDGELSAAELREQDEKLETELDTLKTAMLKADMARESRIETWQGHVAAFLAREENASFANADSPLHGALDLEVRRLQAAAAKEGNDNFDPRILVTARKNITNALSQVNGKPAPKTPKPADADLPAQRDPKDRKMPPNIGGLPTADADDTDDGKFAHLDRLKGEEYESALAKLTPDEREEFLAS